MGYLFIIIGAYIIGSSSMSYYLARLNNINMKEQGSGNLGASNTLLILGWKAGVVVGVHDFLKAILAVNAARWIFPQLAYAGAVAGVSCVLGHIFPFYLHFKGGKGFASYLGMIIAMDWKWGLLLLCIIGAVILLSNYIVGGMLATILLSPPVYGFVERDAVVSGIFLIATVIMLIKHKENFARIRQGTEVKVLAAIRGEHKKYL